MIIFLSGILVMGYCVTSLFFLKFWRRTRDRLFALFSLAFILLAGQRTALTAAAVSSLHTTWYYALRLLAFAIILYAILDKNRAARS